MTVTPFWTGPASALRVSCPTATPSTSVMAFLVPCGSEPRARPRSAAERKPRDTAKSPLSSHGRTSLVHLEVLALLPIGDVLEKAADLESLQLEDVLDEGFAEGLAKEVVPVQYVDSLHQARGETWTIGGVRLLGRSSRIKLSLEP